MVKNTRQTAICAILQQFKTQPDIRLILNLEFVLLTDAVNTLDQQNYSQVYNKKNLSLKKLSTFTQPKLLPTWTFLLMFLPTYQLSVPF